MAKRHRRGALRVFASFALAVGLSAAPISPFTRVAPNATKQSGNVPGDAAAAGRLVLAHEPIGSASLVFELDLSTVPHALTPLARLQLGSLEKIKVSRPNVSPGDARAALHAFVIGANGAEPELAGSLPVKPAGIPTVYTLDVTRAVNGALKSPKGTRTIRLEVRITGKPLPFEVYGLTGGLPALEIASPNGWVDDWEKRLVPITQGPSIYREACVPLTEDRDREIVLTLLYPAKRITEVIANASGKKLQEGRDWILRNGKLVLPRGSQAPVQVASEFFLVPQKGKDGTTRTVRAQVKVMDGAWYHDRQIEVSYEPASRDLQLSGPRSNLNDLPRTKALLASKAPLSVILFGDSISAGYNASKLSGVWPYQPDYGELVVRKLEQQFGSKVTYMNHARAGGTSAHATTQADAQVAWFKPDLVLLAYGMNDRSPERSVAYRANLGKIIDIVRTRSPETEFIVITPMLNSPKQPTGLDPVKFIRDEGLAVARSRIAFVDITTTQLEMMKRKDYLDFSGNGVNHPNDFLMRIYAQRILEVFRTDGAH